MAENASPALEAEGLCRRFGGPGRETAALSDVSLRLDRGEVLAIMGPSGSGKSTLLALLGGLDVPDAGRVVVAGIDWSSLGGADRARFRRRHCGFVVQGLGLLPQATARENIEVPLVLDGVAAADRDRRVTDALDRLGLAARANMLTDQLSGGERQRVAIARALVLGPTVVLADEPTGSLDSANAQTVTRLLVAASQERGAAVIMVTHDPDVARHAHRVITLNGGRLQ